MLAPHDGQVRFTDSVVQPASSTDSEQCGATFSVSVVQPVSSSVSEDLAYALEASGMTSVQRRAKQSFQGGPGM